MSALSGRSSGIRIEGCANGSVYDVSVVVIGSPVGRPCIIPDSSVRLECRGALTGKFRTSRDSGIAGVRYNLHPRNMSTPRVKI